MSVELVGERLEIRVRGVEVGVQLPTWPLPAKVTARVGEPIDWSHLGPDAADDTETVQACYDELTGRMQETLDALAEERQFPVIG